MVTDCTCPFKTEYTPEQFVHHLFERNTSLACYNSTEHYDLLKIKPCLRDDTTFQAVIKVSTSLRKAIHKNKDKLAINYYNCKVYDQLNVGRCNKCQQYGHFSGDCKNDDVCAICNGKHETRKCSHRNEETFSSPQCSNCIRAGKETTNHRADSSQCPCYIHEHDTRLSNFMKILN